MHQEINHLGGGDDDDDLNGPNDGDDNGLNGADDSVERKHDEICTQPSSFISLSTSLE